MHLLAHPLLRPGVRVTRRGDGLLQVGLSLPGAIVAPDSAPIRAALACLESGVLPDLGDPLVARFLQGLLDHELLADGDLLIVDVASAPTHAAYGLGAGAVMRRRAALGIEIVGPAELVEQARGWLPSGLGAEPAVRLVISIGALSREALDPLVRADRPHLVVGTVEGSVKLGPFVAPGLTACLRCVDAHRGEHDPRRSLVLEQYAAAGTRRDGIPEPVDAPALTAALAWAVRDCLTFVDGFEPETWSRTIAFGPGMARVEHEWRRHPHCGCAWGGLAVG